MRPRASPQRLKLRPRRRRNDQKFSTGLTRCNDACMCLALHMSWWCIIRHYLGNNRLIN